MSQNSIYVGLVLVSPISNQKRYEAVLNEILSYLSTKTQDINVQIKPNRFITFFSVNGNICDQVCLPLSPLYLHTSYFRLHQGYQLTVEDKRFATISWEVLNILKENFPSKIYLHQENLELCSEGGQSGFYSPMSQNEELRRQISCLLSLREEGKPLTMDELEDVWHTLQFSEKIGDAKSQNTCLELIQQGAPLQMICAIKIQIDIETLRRIAEKGDYTQLSSNKIIAIDLLNKIENLDNSKALINGHDTLQKQLNELNQCDDSISSMGCTDAQGPQSNNPTLERPTSTRMCLFQLSESNDLNRVTLILDTLSMRSKETLSQMKKKYNLNSKLVSILKKYCNGDYGFDQQSSRHGHFQLNLLKLLIVLSQDYAVYLEYLQSQALDFLCQIIEEGVIFAYEDALAGDQANGQTPQNEKLYKFLSGALDVIEMAVSKQFNEYVPAIKDNLVKILNRIGKLMSKKENALLNYFIQQYSTAGTTYGTNQNIVLQDGILNYDEQHHQMGTTNSMCQTMNTHIQVEQMHELKAVSEGLYFFTVKLQDQVQRIEALQDFNEHYEEKHRRLFYKVTGIYLQKNEGSVLEKYQMEAVCESNNDVTKDRYQKKVSSNKVQFRGAPSQHQSYDNQEEDRYYEHKQVSYQKEKPVYTNDDSCEYRAKVQSKKKTDTNQSNYIANKENEPHYIGNSPIQHYRKPGTSKKNEEDYLSNNNFKRNNLILNMNSRKSDLPISFHKDKMEKVSPIRQTGFMIGHDFSSHHQQFELNEQDIRSTNEDSKITNLSTLSPQKNSEMKDEPLRKLESQPLYSSNNPLTSSSGDRLRKHRFGRPNTNSPFPNINNIRNHKNQQQQNLSNLPPTTAATSTKNQMQSEHVNTPSNQLEFNSSYGPSFIPSYNNQSFLNSYNEVGSYYQQNIEEERYISQSFFQQQPLGDIAPSIMQIVSQEYNSNPQITKSTIIQKKNNHLRDSFQKTPLKHVIPPSIPVYEQKTLKRGGGRTKIQSEPNSPKMQIFDSQSFQRPAHGSKVTVTGGHAKVDGKDIQLRLSTNKMSLIKNQYGASGKHIKQSHQQKLKKKFANYSAEGIDIQGCLTPSSENSSSKNKHKQSSFLPKLDRNNRDLNAQVLYIDLQSKNKSEIKERVDISCKSPTNNWIKEIQQEQNKMNNIVIPERRKSNHKTDNTQLYTPSTTTISNQFELSPEFIRNPKQLSHHFQAKNIGKMIPIHELKNIINEQVIRSKLNRGNNNNNDHIFPNHHGIMSEVVSPKNSPLSTRQNETSRVIRGRVLIHDPIVYNQNKRLAQEILNEDNNITLSKFFQQRSGSQCSSNQLEEADLNQVDDKILTQFHLRTNSVNQVQKAKGLSIHGINTHQQFNTIEEVMSNSKGLGKHGENSSARNEINISNIHVPIKPIASKQMPKCFRMSKHQIKQVHKSYKHSHEINKSGFPQQTNNSSFLYDKRPSHIVDNYKMQSFNNMFVNNHNNNNNNQRADFEVQSAVQIMSNGGYAQDLYREKIMETEEEERARMTPAFNQRRKESFNVIQ